MFRLALFSLFSTMVLSGCSRSPSAREAAVRLTVTYNFKARCIVVVARDGSGGGETREALTDKLKDFAQGSESAVLAVFRKESWSRTMNLTATAYESTSCEGTALVERALTVELPETQVVEHALDLSGPDGDGDGYIAADDDGGGTDCDDTAADIHPSATEVCDGKDNDCDDQTDEDVLPSWYPDRDGDGFGDKTATPLLRCTQPPAQGFTKYVEDHSDCLDSDTTVFPQKDFTETRCDGVDDDCDGVVDEGFPDKGKDCSDPCPTGKWACNSSKNALICEGAPPKESFYPDRDGDGAGDDSGAAAGSRCSGEQLPPNTATNRDDCDDQDPYNRRGKAETCDARDNNCNAMADENSVCMGKTWKVMTNGLPANVFWKTVGLGANGRVWMAGTGAHLALRPQADQAFASLDCGSINWNAAWVPPGYEGVFLAGEGGKVSLHDGTKCLGGQDLTNSPVTAIMGRTEAGKTRVYAVNVFGMLYAWSPSEDQVTLVFDKTPQAFFGIHALDGTPLLLVGGTNEHAPAAAQPYIASHPGTGDLGALKEHTLNGLPSGYTGSVRAVWMISPSLAYAVGDKGLVLRWDGQQTWTRIAPYDNTAVDYTSVVALDPYSVYVTDTEGRVLLRKPVGWAPNPLYDGPQPLRDIAANAANDIWAVGDSGLVVHFAE
jgi:hypothetical protein